MEDDKVVHSGPLQLPPNSKLILKKTWQQKFCQLYKASKFGIERLEIFDNFLDSTRQIKRSPSKIITLENCVKVAKRSTTVFIIVTKSGTYEFNAHNEKDLEEWIVALQSVAFRDNSSKITTLVEDNDLYCSIGEGIFNVKLCETDASLRCNLTAKNYILVLTTLTLQLREVIDNSLLFTWPYQYVRRYGYSRGNFTFEAGRKCESGEGKFLLEHSNEQEIFRYLTMKMKSMKKLLKSDSVSTMECGDKQLQAVLNMEARSRSPLPPSPTTSTTFQELEHLTLEANDKRSNKPEVTPMAPPKPPRKNIPCKENSLKDDYEFISKYDEVECRSGAWQKLGLCEVKHNENFSENEEIILKGRKSPPAMDACNTSLVPKVITEMESDYDSYNKLNFFGSSSKLNTPGYKQVWVSPNVPLTPPSYNDYDEVNLLECIRPADDSHLGYAVVRKKETQVDHKSFNDTEYAIISKPKRV